MNEPLHPEATAGTSTKIACKPEALVVIAEDSAEQVVLNSRRGPLFIRINAVKDDGIEFVGPAFFPKNTQLKLELDPEDDGEEPDTSAAIHLHGVVAKVQMLNAAPTYKIWVQLENFDPAVLHALWLRCRAAADSGAETTPRYVTGTKSIPNWAARLVGEGVISELDLEKVVASAETDQIPLSKALIQAELVQEEQVARSMAMEFSVPFVDVHAFNICMSNRQLIPLDIARKQQLFPLFNQDGILTLGMSNPTDLAVIDQVRLQTNCQVEPCLITAGAIRALIEGAGRELGAAEVLEELETESRWIEDESTAIIDSENSTVSLVRAIVEESANSGASDIHIEPEHNQLRVRVRIDGVLREKSVHSRRQHASIVSRIKVMAKLDIAETRRPQDGHFSMKLESGKADVRVSTIPTVYGENVVLRLLLSDSKVLELKDLGMAPSALQKMEEFLDNPHGMILVTGPTGSGKTTTLYAALARLATPERNVVTVEDPVEKRIQFLRQTEVNPKAGVTFSTGLRSILRQDPDVIMIGEIRDKEAAELAVQAALTGHLVLSTLHTNNASGAIIRLSEIGIPPFLITSSLRAVVSQRLARRVCQACAHEIEPDPKLLLGLGFEEIDNIRFMAGSGCGVCLNTGYQGRIGLYEMLELNSELSSALLGKASRSEIEKSAAKAILCSMRLDGLRRIREGLTTLEEVARTVGLSHAPAEDSGGAS
jgi:type IV pilus assembly protein PilB